MLRNKIANISWWAVKRWYVTVLVFASLIGLGWYSYTNVLPREGLPTVQFPLTIVRVNSVGSSASQLDRSIAQPLQKSLQNSSDIESIQTNSQDDTFSATVFFKESIEPEDGTNKVKQVFKSFELPDQANASFITVNPAKYLNRYDLLLSLYSINHHGVNELEEKAKSLSDSIESQQYVKTAKPEFLTASFSDPQTGMTAKQQLFYTKTGVKENGRLNFYDGIIIGINRTDDADSLDLSENIKQWIGSNRGRLEKENFGVAIGADFATTIKNNISSLEENLLTGIAAVLIVTFLLIGIRASFIIAGFMVTVILITLLIFWGIDYSLNVITLFALVLTLGLFVDDATIMTEALDAESKRFNNMRLAVKTAGKKVALASFAGTLTTVLVFLPLVFISGILGDFIRYMPVTVIISLLTSYVASILLVPVLARFTIFRSKRPSKWNLTGLEKRISYWLANSIRQLKQKPFKGLIWASAMVGLSIGMFICGVILSKELTFNIFPPSKDSDQLQIRVDFVPGTDLNISKKITDKLDKKISATESKNVEKAVYAGATPASNQSADISLFLTPVEDRDSANSSVAIMNRLQPKLEKIAGNFASVRIVQIDAGPPAEQFPFKVQVTGEDSEKTLVLAKDISEFLNGKQIVKLSGGKSKVVDTKIDYANGVTRIDGKRTIEVSAAFDDDDTSALVNAAKELVQTEFDEEKIASYGLKSSSVTYDFGQESENAESFKSLSFVFPIALLAMLILLFLQFRSLIQPLLIFLAIPFSFFGVVAALLLTNNALSFFSMVGIIGLVGIAVNNTIMLTDYANQARREHIDLIEAIAVATQERFRPLITTTLTTVVALLPLALYDPFWQPLASVIIGGLLSSTFLVIIAFPYYYYFITGLSSKLRKNRSKK